MRRFGGRCCGTWLGRAATRSSGSGRRLRGRVGAQLLEKQDSRGGWAAGKSGDGGLCSPKWTSTTYTMLLLRDLGMPAGNQQARKACKLLLDGGLQPDGGIN